MKPSEFQLENFKKDYSSLEKEINSMVNESRPPKGGWKTKFRVRNRIRYTETGIMRILPLMLKNEGYKPAIKRLGKLLAVAMNTIDHYERECELREDLLTGISEYHIGQMEHEIAQMKRMYNYRRKTTEKYPKATISEKP